MLTEHFTCGEMNIKVAIGICVCPAWRFGTAESEWRLQHFAGQANYGKACDNDKDGTRSMQKTTLPGRI